MDSKYRISVSRPNTYLACFVILKYHCWFGAAISTCVFFSLSAQCLSIPKHLQGQISEFQGWSSKIWKINKFPHFFYYLPSAGLIFSKFISIINLQSYYRWNKTEIPLCFCITSITEATKGVSTIAKFMIHIINVGNRSALFFHLKLNTPLLFPCIYVALSTSYI